MPKEEKPKEEKKAEKKEQVISVFDPARNAYFDAPISVAKEFVKSAKEVEAKLAEIEEQ